MPFRKTLLIKKKLSRFRIEPALLLAALFFSPQPQVVVRGTLIILMFSMTHLALKPVVIKRYHKMQYPSKSGEDKDKLKLLTWLSRVPASKP